MLCKKCVDASSRAPKDQDRRILPRSCIALLRPFWWLTRMIRVCVFYFDGSGSQCTIGKTYGCASSVNEGMPRTWLLMRRILGINALPCRCRWANALVLLRYVGGGCSGLFSVCATQHPNLSAAAQPAFQPLQTIWLSRTKVW